MWYMKQRSIRRFSDWNARHMTPGWTPNEVSVQRIYLTVLMVPCLLFGYSLLGCAVFALIMYMDFLDGALARYQEALIASGELPKRRARWPAWVGIYGESPMGAWLDPLCDKIAIWAALVALGWSALGPWFIGAGLFLAVCLTGVRPFKVWLKRRGLRRSSDGRANAFGKIKMWTQCAAILLLMWHPGRARVNAARDVVAAALVLATLSLVWHLLPPRSQKTR